MKHGHASRTAVGAAAHRAAHQTLDGGMIFADPLAFAILGDDAAEAIERATERPEQRPLRLFIAMRSRFAEDSAKVAVAAGVRQTVLLGAGLDTFAYRLEPLQALRVFELDHPATQADKRHRLAAAQIAEPPHVAYVAHDFDRGSFTAALAASGLDPRARTFVMWLGVTAYLTEAAIGATLAEIAHLAGGADVVFDYVNPSATIDDVESRRAFEALASRAAELDEPFRGALDTLALHERARTLGFVEIEDLDRAVLGARYLPRIPPPKPGRGAHIVRMATL
jgi:methyltransferase (TIGR00027 family)